MPALEVASLTKRYGRVVAVDDASLSVERGSIFGLLGPNGSGKTTMLACALGLLRPTRGRISVLGEEPSRFHRTRGRVGVVFDESVRVRGLSVRAQLDYATRLRGHSGGRSAEEALELVGIAHLARRQVTRLSLGQTKRLAVATALAGKPELLVLDEPLSGLDPLGVRDLLRLLRSLAEEGVTVVLSSHRLHEVEPVLTHAAILLAGRVAAQGSLAELLTGRGRYRVEVDDVPRARATLDRAGGVTVEAYDGSLLVEPGSHPIAHLNRALVEAGVAVSALHPPAASLPALFSSLVDELEAGR